MKRIHVCNLAILAVEFVVLCVVSFVLTKMLLYETS